MAKPQEQTETMIDQDVNAHYERWQVRREPNGEVVKEKCLKERVMITPNEANILNRMVESADNRVYEYYFLHQTA